MDSRAKGVRTSISDVTDKIGGLREILVRVVRTSTEDANRRIARRYPVASRGEILDRKGRPLQGELLDVSESGAKIRCTPEMQPGETGALKLEGISTTLPFVVRATQADCLHVELQLTDSQKDSYRRWLSSRVGDLVQQAS